MKTTRLTRLMACFLAAVMLFSLLPMPQAQASQGDVRPREVPVRDQFDNKTSVVRMAVQGDRYYISIEEATKMLNIHKTGGGYVTDHGYFKVNLPPKKLEWVELGGTRYYALEPLMNQLETTIYSLDDGMLGYNSVPKNKDRLYIESENAFLDRINSADWVESDGLEIFGIVYDWVRNRRLEAIWGDATKDDLKDLMAEMIKPVINEPAFIEKAEGYYDKAVFAAGMVKKADKALPKTLNILFGDDLGEMLLENIQNEKWYQTSTSTAKAIKIADGSGVFTEFFCCMSGYPSSELKNAPEMPQLDGIGLGDILATAVYLSGISKASSQYADAMANVLDWYDDCDRKFVELERQMAEGGKRVVSDYQAFATKNAGTAVLRSAAHLLEEVPEKTTINLLDELLIGKASLVSTVIDTVDRFTLGTMEKNTAVKTAAFCRFIQHWLDKLYFSARKDAPDRLLLYRDAAMLYLKAGWLSYNAIPSEEITKDVTEQFKMMFLKKIASLARYDEADFHFEKNEGHLNAGGQGTEPALPPWDYMSFITSWKWLEYVTYEYDYPQAIRGQYCIYDVDKDGSEDVIITSGSYYGGMIFQCFSRKKDGIVLLGDGPFSETNGNFLSGHDDIAGLMISGFHSGKSWNRYYGIKGGTLVSADYEEYEQGEKSRLYTGFWCPLGAKELPPPPAEMKGSDGFDPNNILGITLGYGMQWSFCGTRPMFPDGTEEEQRMFTQDYRACFTFYENGTLDFFLYVPYSDYSESSTGTYTVDGNEVKIQLRYPDNSYVDCTYLFNSHDISFKQLSKQGIEYSGKKGETYRLEQYPWEDAYYEDFDGEVYDESDFETQATQPAPKPKPIPQPELEPTPQPQPTSEPEPEHPSEEETEDVPSEAEMLSILHIGQVHEQGFIDPGEKIKYKIVHCYRTDGVVEYLTFNQDTGEILIATRRSYWLDGDVLTLASEVDGTEQYYKFDPLDQRFHIFGDSTVGMLERPRPNEYLGTFENKSADYTVESLHAAVTEFLFG